MSKEDAFLNFIFEEMWPKDLTRGMISDTLSDFIDIAPEELFDVDMDLVCEKLRNSVLKELQND